MSGPEIIAGAYYTKNGHNLSKLAHRSVPGAVAARVGLTLASVSVETRSLPLPVLT